MNRAIALMTLLLIAGVPPYVGADSLVSANAISLEHAFRSQLSDVQIQGLGTVIRLLTDDNRGSRHQKFILRMPSGQTVLIAHNIDLAPKIADLRVGDTVSFYGEYEWNEKGGTVHWTHRDPARRHIDGWLNVAGRVYQ